VSRVAPLLCAGITTYSPLRAWNIGPGSRVAVVGLGGLGHMAVKLASALGAIVTVVSRTADKAEDATSLGADAFLLSTDGAAMEKAACGFDLIIDTIPVRHDVNRYLPLLDVDGTLVLVGQVGLLDSLTTVPLIVGRRRIAGSPIGGILETQELLDFCARKNVLPDCEMIRMDQINEAWERMERADVRYRFVIDMASIGL
jgi:alcohol dehydrogenase (NADP+)